MENNVQPTIPPTIWESNPKLKILLLILIAVFLFSGMGLTVFAVFQNEYRQKIYYETQAALPVHKVVKSENQKIGESDIAGWKTYRNDEYGFEFDYPASFVLRVSTATSTYLNLSNGSDSERISLQILEEKFDPNNIKGLYGKIQNATQEPYNGINWYSYYDGEICDGRNYGSSFNSETLFFKFTSCVDNEIGIQILNSETIHSIVKTFKFAK